MSAGSSSAKPNNNEDLLRRLESIVQEMRLSAQVAKLQAAAIEEQTQVLRDELERLKAIIDRGA